MSDGRRAAELDELVNRADLDGLVRHVDATCAAREWDHLVRVRDRSRAAVDTGRQLWPIATLANYRLALWAPAPWAVRSLEDTARTFMPGPVSEILAVHHPWAELAPHLPPGHDRALVAHERSMRGDDVGNEPSGMVDVPVRIARWEPAYAMATYSDDGVDCPAPGLPTSHDAPESWPPCEVAVGTPVIDDPDTVTAFRRLVEPWTSQSNGSARVAVAEGGSAEALGALGLHDARCTPMSPAEGLAWLAWAGASGGAHGKRRGAATGRAEAWWFLASFTGLSDDWPCDADIFGEVASSLRVAAWNTVDSPTGGWQIRLVITDPDEGVSVALEAVDRA